MAEICVVPTPVGMDLRQRNLTTCTKQLSPRRWGWTIRRCCLRRPLGLSPRLWGWTGAYPFSCHIGHVVPTPVGMDRLNVEPIRLRGRCPHACGDGPLAPEPMVMRLCCPHACGDGPQLQRSSVARMTLSPRLWGWTGGGRDHNGIGVVVPTPVGMDR